MIRPPGSLIHTHSFCIKTIDQYVCVITISIIYSPIDSIDAGPELESLASTTMRGCLDSWASVPYAGILLDLEEAELILSSSAIHIHDCTLHMDCSYRIWTDTDSPSIDVYELDDIDRTIIPPKLTPIFDINRSLVSAVTGRWRDDRMPEQRRIYKFMSVSADRKPFSYRLAITYKIKGPYFEQAIIELIERLTLLYSIIFRMSPLRTIRIKYASSLTRYPMLHEHYRKIFLSFNYSVSV